MSGAPVRAGPPARTAPPPAGLALWSGVACLYAGAATALALLWSPV